MTVAALIVVAATGLGTAFPPAPAPQHEHGRRGHWPPIDAELRDVDRDGGAAVRAVLVLDGARALVLDGAARALERRQLEGALVSASQGKPSALFAALVR